MLPRRNATNRVCLWSEGELSLWRQDCKMQWRDTIKFFFKLNVRFQFYSVFLGNWQVRYWCWLKVDSQIQKNMIFPEMLKSIFKSLYQLRKPSYLFCGVFRPMFSACGEMHKIVLSWPWFQFHLGSCYDLEYFIDKLLFALKTHV